MALFEADFFQTAELPQSRHRPPKRRPRLGDSPFSGHRLILGDRLAVQIPPSSAIWPDVGWSAHAMALATPPPLLASLRPFDSRASVSMGLAIQIPEPRAIWEFDSRAVWPVKLSPVVSVLPNALAVDGESNF
ncbi:MAG: hypothetical protein WD872_07560 [Pirellulaceae bacterium]